MTQRPQYDCFLTHNWEADESGRNNHEAVSKINAALKDKGLETWFDEDRMEGFVLDQMTRGIDNSAVVVAFITNTYMDKVGSDRHNDYCKIEFNYAVQRKSATLIGVPMEKHLLNTQAWHGPAGAVLSGKLYEAQFAFNLDTYQQKFGLQVDNLYRQILRLKGTPNKGTQRTYDDIISTSNKLAPALQQPAPALQRSRRTYEDIISTSNKLAPLMRGMRVNQKMDLSNQSLMESDAKIVSEAMNTASWKNLHLSGNKFGSEGATSLADGLRLNDTIRMLWLKRNEIGNHGAVSLGRALEKNKTLRYLNLSDNLIKHNGGQSLARGLQLNATLKTIELDSNNIGPEGARSFAECLRVSRALEKLSLVANEIGDDGAVALANALQVNKTLNSLPLRRNGIGPRGARSLADGLRVNATLRMLYLSFNKIGDNGAIELGNALQMNTGLKILCLDSNEIGDNAAVALGEALKVNKKLEKLNLSNNSIGPEGTRALADGLQSNHTLKTLTLTTNPIGDTGRAALGPCGNRVNLRTIF